MSDRLAKIVFSVAGVVLISRLLGYIREMIIAERFGTSVEYDLYLVALILPAIVYGVINFAAVYLFVPYLSNRLTIDNQNHNELNWRQIWPSFNLTFISSLLIVVLIYFGSPYFMKIWGKDYSSEQFEQIIFLTRLTSLMILLSTSEAFMRAFLNVKKVFSYPAGGFIIFNLVSISVILLFSHQLSVKAIAIGLLTGLLFQNLFLFIKVAGFKPFNEFTAKFYNNDTKAILSTVSILIFIELINRSYVLIDRYIAGQLGDGIIAALNYSQVVVLLPESIIGFAIGAVVFPYFSDLARKESYDNFGLVYKKVISGALFVAVIITSFIFVNSKEIIYLLFFRGMFDSSSVTLTSDLLLSFAPSVIALFIISASIRACYSLNKRKLVLFFTVLMFVLKFAGNFIFTYWFGYQGITMASSLSFLLFASLLVLTILTTVKFNNKKQFVQNIIKILFIGVLTTICIFFIKDIFPESLSQLSYSNSIITLLLSGVLIVIIFLLFSCLFGLKTLIKDLVVIREKNF
jgi:putative peptidoglycan lipid II flippase